MNRQEFIMLVGLPGSGKSTYAESHISTHTVISSDAIRKEISGDASVQANPEEVFNLMKVRTLKNLADGNSVIYDATNLIRKHRVALLQFIPTYVYKKCIIVWSPIENCVSQDNSRDRIVGPEVIDRMVKYFQPPYYDEGFDEIEVLVGNEFDQEEYAQKQFDNLHIPHDNPHHTLDIDKHSFKAAELVGNDDEVLHMATLLHDIGKPYTKAFKDRKDNPTDIAHYYNHQNVGAWISYGICGDVDIAWLIGYHMEPFFNSKYYNNLNDYLKELIDRIHKADVEAH